MIVNIDGGSRGNPGPAGYGVRFAAPDGSVVAEFGDTIGVATNNVAEYRGLLAALRYAVDHEYTDLTVRSDSLLLVCQMRGEYRVKNPGLQPLHAEAREVAPPGTTYTWVPRAQNAAADALANRALDGDEVAPGPVAPAHGSRGERPDEDSLIEEIESPGAVRGEEERDQAGHRGWAAPTGAPTTLVLVRHGVT